jgi:hypothetical protein
MPPPFTCRLCQTPVDAWSPLHEAPWRVFVHLLGDHLCSRHWDVDLRPIPAHQTPLEGLLEQVYDPPAGFDVTRGMAAN